MFYLKLFFKTVLEVPFRGTLFLILTCVLAFYWQARTSVNTWVSNVLAKEQVLPYFYALVRSEALTREHEKLLKNIPGVHSFSFSAKSEIQDKVMQELAEVFSSEKEGELAVLKKTIMELDYVGLKVTLKADQKDITNQITYQSIVRLFAAENLIVSPIRGKVSESVKKVGLWPVLISEYGTFALPIILLLLWPIALYSFASSLRKRAYLIEHYARKNLVCFKTLIAGLGAIVLFTSSILIVIHAPVPRFLDVAILLIILFLASGPYLRRWSWN